MISCGNGRKSKSPGTSQGPPSQGDRPKVSDLREGELTLFYVAMENAIVTVKAQVALCRAKTKVAMFTTEAAIHDRQYVHL